MQAMLDPLAGLVLGLLFLMGGAVCLWPQHGLLARWRRSGVFRGRVLQEDALKHLYKEELGGRRPTLQSLAGSLQVKVARAAELVATLQRGELVQVEGAEPQLTPAGRRYALNVVRAHRLWEKHLAEKTGVAESQWHQLAEAQEHRITPEAADRLAAGLGYPAFDPHGDPIPTADGEFAPGEGRPLATLAANEWARVWHVEDEPESVYAQIRAIGLYPGTLVRLIESTPRRVCIWVDGEEHLLAPVVAANVSVRPVPAVISAAEEAASHPLSQLAPGVGAVVSRISPQCRGVERRRLLDFGILPGTRIEAEMVSPAGGLTAYRVRDTLIALRQEQAGLIFVRKEEGQ